MASMSMWQRSAVALCLLAALTWGSDAFSGELETICKKIDDAPINKNLLHRDNRLYDQLERRLDTVLDGEKIFIDYKIRASVTTDCRLRVYGSLFISELKEHRRPDKRHFDAVATNPKLTVDLMTATYDTLSRRLNFAEYGAMLATLLPEDIVQASLVAQLDKFLQNPYSPFTLGIGYFGRMKTVSSLPPNMIQDLKRIDYFKVDPGNRMFYPLDTDHAVVALTMLHNVGVRHSYEDLKWLFTLIEKDFSRFDEEESLHGTLEQARIVLTKFVDRLTKETVIKASEIPRFWFG